ASSGAPAGASKHAQRPKRTGERKSPTPKTSSAAATKVKADTKDQAEDCKPINVHTEQAPLAPVTGDAGGAVTHPKVGATTNPNLSKKEQVLLSEYEAIIKENRQSFFQLGEPLRSIRDDKLYRQEHATFEEY